MELCISHILSLRTILARAEQLKAQLNDSHTHTLLEKAMFCFYEEVVQNECSSSSLERSAAQCSIKNPIRPLFQKQRDCLLNFTVCLRINGTGRTPKPYTNCIKMVCSSRKISGWRNVCKMEK
jgi:hypothetical protein